MRAINAAYEVLSDPDGRTRYDRFGHDGMAGREFHTEQFMDLGNLGDLLERWPDGPWEPDFAQGVAVQAVCDAIERSAAERRWVEIREVADQETKRP